MNSKVKSLLSVGIIGGLLMTGGSAVYANSIDNTTATDSTQTKQTQVRPERPDQKGSFNGGERKGQRPQNEGKLMKNDPEQMKAMLAAFVADGTLTQANVDSITAFMATKDAERKEEQDKVAKMTSTERKAYFDQKDTATKQARPDMFSEMVTSGIITQAQADSIKAKNQEQRLATRQAEQKTRLDTLVASDTITSAQVDQILAYFASKHAARTAEMDKIKAMTEEERAAYLETLKGTRQAPLAGLVDAGTLTQAQADAVTEVTRPTHPGGHRGGLMDHKQE